MLNTLFSGMGADSSYNFITVILVYSVIFIGFYFIFFRPNQKKKKQEEALQNSLKIGDEVTTIGGIIGKIVSIKDDNDSIVIETGIDRSKVNIKKWAVAEINNLKVPEKK